MVNQTDLLYDEVMRLREVLSVIRDFAQVEDHEIWVKNQYLDDFITYELGPVVARHG